MLSWVQHHYGYTTCPVNFTSISIANYYRPGMVQVPSSQCLITMTQHLVLVGRRFGGYQVDAEQRNPEVKAGGEVFVKPCVLSCNKYVVVGV